MGNLIGLTKPACPYCGVILPEFPIKKTKCKDCGNFFTVKKRYIDNVMVIIKLEERDSLWQQNHDFSIQQPVFTMVGEKEEFEAFKQDFLSKGMYQYSTQDLVWKFFNHKNIEYAKNNQWGLYACNYIQIAKYKKLNGHEKHALDLYLTGIYLIYNGPENVGKVVFDWSPPFNPKFSSIPTYIVEEIRDLSKSLNFTYPAIEKAFFDNSEPYYENLKLPFSPSQAWVEIGRAIETGVGIDQY